LFEGTPRDMYESLNSTLAALPDKTRVYFGHEYTENNLRFAATLEPSNNDIRQKARRIAALRTERRTSVPTTLSEERATNPFLRTNSTELIRSLGLASGADPVEVLAAARAAKDRF
jgi:hydroxyacylglutathione hydrolase